MAKRLLLGLMLIVVVGLATIGFVPSWRVAVLGFLKGEPSYEGRPLGAWIATLKDGDATSRRKAAAALGRLGAKAEAAVPPLCAALRDDEGEVRREAAYALGSIGPVAQEAIPALREALRDGYGPVRRAAAVALYRIDPHTKETVPGVAELMGGPHDDD